MHGYGMSPWDTIEVAQERSDSGLEQSSFSEMKRRA